MAPAVIVTDLITQLQAHMHHIIQLIVMVLADIVMEHHLTAAMDLEAMVAHQDIQVVHQVGKLSHKHQLGRCLKLIETGLDGIFK